MTHRGKPKKIFSFRKKKKNVIPLKPPRPVYVNPCFACDILNMAGKITGHPGKGHTDKATGQRCTCWCNK